MGFRLLVATCAVLFLSGLGARAQPAEQVELERLYQIAVPFMGSVDSAPLHVSVRGSEMVIVPAQNGNVFAFDPASGDQLWKVRVPTPSGERPLLNATPSTVGELLFVAYGTRVGFDRQRHLVSVIDLSRGEISSDFPTVELSATKPANDGGVVTFNPPTALSRAALVHAGRERGSLGMLYVPFGNAQDVQPWHGWLFEIDIDAWKQNGASAAISAVFLTTPEAECPGRRGGTDMICGGGIWHFGGPHLVEKDDGYELLVTTGNGELYLPGRNYAQSVLRLSRGLSFDPQCNADECAAFNPLAPSEACLRSCENIFIPRLMPGDPPLRPASGRCDGETFLECLAGNDWDLGANGAVQVRLGFGSEVIVQPGKDGGLYMFDARKMGRMYDRDQIVPICGTPEDPCGDWFQGMIRAQPLVTDLGGEKVVIVPTFVPDRTQPAGVVARRIVNDDDGPRFEPLWQAPPADSPEAVARFRSYPSLTFLTQGPEGHEYVWVVDTTNEDTLIGIRVSDGLIVTRQPLAGSVYSVRPAHRNGIIYIVSKPEGGSGVLEAFQIWYPASNH